jgi:nitrite reductase (NO-forming)
MSVTTRADITERTVLERSRGADRAEVGPDRRARGYLAARVLFGAVWAIDATLKWLPGFRHGFGAMVAGEAQGQPGWLVPWFHFWARVTASAPGTYATLTALAETAIALCLIFGVLQRAGWIFGGVFAVLIWGVGEGFGGPYGSGSTDIGCAVIYAVMFAVLALAVPRTTRAAAPAVDHRLLRLAPALRPLTFG